MFAAILKRRFRVYHAVALSVFSTCLSVLSPTAPASPRESAPQSETAQVDCLDSDQLAALFQAGELESVYRNWLAFFQRNRILRLSVDMPCWLEGQKVLGVLHAVLMGDTVRSRMAFWQVARNAPATTLWNFNLPYEIQAMWEEIWRETKYEFSPAEAWNLHWTPPPLFESGADRRRLELRRLYHDARIIYGLTESRDPEPYVRILRDLQKQQDVAFLMMRAEAMLRLGYGPGRIREELAKLGGASDEVIAHRDLVHWVGRMNYWLRNISVEAPGKNPSESPGKDPVLTRPRGTR